MPGPPPEPTRLKLLKGNPGKRALNKREPKPDPVGRVPDRPKYLGRVGAAAWRKWARQLTRTKILTVADLELLGACCREWERWRELDAWTKEHGETYVIRDKAGAVKYVAQLPQVAMARYALEGFRKLASELGLSPASRSRIRAPKEEGPPSAVSRRRGGAWKQNRGAG